MSVANKFWIELRRNGIWSEADQWFQWANEFTREGNATMAMECENNAWTIFYAGRVRA